ncbi:MAG: ATP-binding cassette domain-containing protein [Burkholderiales bacterium]|nr:ATP-binding cassette domain-containing protein [Burkholderiales bacterium]
MPLLQVQGLVKRYQRGWLRKETTFELQADFEIAGPAIVGVMGANGAGKTTLFELITGGNRPSAGRVCVEGQDVHRVRYAERARVALHYHQSYQLRTFQRSRPSFMLQPARSERARVHLFDEPQFNTQDGYIGFMLDFFRRLHDEGRLVFLCLHPNEPVHLDILAEVCTRFIFVRKDAARVSRLLFADSLEALMQEGAVAGYLGRLAPHRTTA